MRFYIKERVWSLPEAFIVRDDAGNAVFEIRGKFFHFGDDLVMVDSSTGQELVHIQQHVLSLMPLYEMYRNGQLLASVHEQFRLFGEGFKIEAGDGSTLHVNGDIWQWNFSVTNDTGQLLAQIGRQFSLFRDSYAIDVAPAADAPFMVALVIVIDMVREHHEQQHHVQTVH